MTAEQSSSPVVAKAVRFSDWLVRPLQETDIDAYVALFKEVFAANATPQEWQWKYGGTRGLSLGLWKPDGSLVGHYGVTKRPYRTGQNTFTVVHAGDVMMSPSVRGVFSKRGPFHMLTDGIIERCFGANGFAEFGFGIPNKRHFTLGEMLGHYWELETLWDIRMPSALSTEVAKHVITRLGGADVQTIGGAMAPVLREGSDRQSLLMPHRSAQWLTERYMRHPSKGYQIFRVEQQCPYDVMYVVIRDVPPRPTEDIECLEWFAGPRCGMDAAHALRTLAGSLGAKGAMVWGTSPVLNALRPTSAPNSEPIQFTEICKVAAAQPAILGQPIQSWHGRFWLTGADTDFR